MNVPRNNAETSNGLMGRLIPAPIAAALFLSGCAGERPRPVALMPDTVKREAGRDAGRAEKGDLARVNYTVTLDDGSLVSTTLPAVVEDKTTVRSGWTE